jgi:hypothetical protein
LNENGTNILMTFEDGTSIATKFFRSRNICHIASGEKFLCVVTGDVDMQQKMFETQCFTDVDIVRLEVMSQ